MHKYTSLVPRPSLRGVQVLCLRCNMLHLCCMGSKVSVIFAHAQGEGLGTRLQIHGSAGSCMWL